VETIGGAGGTIGTSRVAKAAPDGYQFVLGSVGTHAQSQSLLQKPQYDAARDFAPVALIVETPVVLVTRRDLPPTNLQEFISYAKSNQKRIQYGSGGAGSPAHLACALLNAAIGVNVVHIPFRGGGPAMQEMIAGRIDYQCLATSVALPQIAAKTIRPIALLGRERSQALPHLASAHEQGLVNLDAGVWQAFFLPKRTPVEIVRKLNGATVATMTTASVQAKLEKLGAVVVAPERRSPEYLQQFVISEIKKWAAVIKAAAIAQQ
jgi:tripartite-type tricarboxylate transporter receptor subunit TctC